ncbi:MAG: Flp pilus assembly protein CpaB [Pirellulales bacterium]
MSRLSAGTILAGIMAVLFGLLGAYVVRKQLLNPPVAAKKEEKPAELVTVPVAAANIPAGRKITLGDIAIMRLKPDQLKAKGFDKPFMNRTNQIIGRVLKDDLKGGGSFAPDAFYPEGQGPNVADKLLPGYRAVTFSVQVDAAVAGFTSAGSVVDVLFRSHQNEASDIPEMTVPLLEGVTVLALNEETAKNVRAAAPIAKHSVTIAVRPEQAAALQVVAGRGELSLALRNPEDTEQFTSTMPRTLEDLLSVPTTRTKVEVYRGRSMSKIEFKHKDRTTPTAPAVVEAKGLPANGGDETPATSVAAPVNNGDNTNRQ